MFGRWFLGVWGGVSQGVLTHGKRVKKETVGGTDTMLDTSPIGFAENVYEVGYAL